MTELELLRESLENPSKIKKVKRSISKFFKDIKTRYQETKAIATGEKYAVSTNYEGAPSVSQEIVEQNPDKWIIKECQSACKILWSKNIYTFMCSDPLDQNAWIEIKLSNLSEENKLILEEIKKKYITYQYHYGCINIEVKGLGKNAEQELINMANTFVMQDIPEEGKVTMDEILIYFECTKKIKNPKYRPLEEQLKDVNFANWGAPLEEEYLILPDYDKMIMSEKEYIEKFGAIEDEGTIYRSRFHYAKHIAYNVYNHKKNK